MRTWTIICSIGFVRCFICALSACAATGEVADVPAAEVASFATKGPNALKFAWPAGLVAGKTYDVKVERTDVNGVTRTGTGKKVIVIAGVVPPAVPPPRITGAHSQGHDEGDVNCGGSVLIVEGENLETATQVELLDDGGVVFHTAPATYADGKLTTEYISLAGNPGSGIVRVTTSGGSDNYAVMYSNH